MNYLIVNQDYFLLHRISSALFDHMETLLRAMFFIIQDFMMVDKYFILINEKEKIII